MFYIDNVACMVPLSSTAILWTSQCTSNRFIYCLVATRYRRSLYILSSTVQTLFNSPGLSEHFVVVGTEVSQEEGERESLRAVGVGTWWKTQHVYFLWPWGRKHWCFPMPPIPIVLRSSFLFLLAHIVIWGKARDFNKHIWIMKAQRWDRKRKKWGPKNSGHGNMEESSTDGYLLEVGSASSFPDASYAYCSLVLLPFPFGSHDTILNRVAASVPYSITVLE